MTNYRILILDAIAQRGLDRFARDRYELGAAISHPDALLVRSRSLHDWPWPPCVKAVGRAGAGTNNIPVQVLSARGVPVFNTPGANANAVQELVLASLLLAARNIVPALRFVADVARVAPDLERAVEEGKQRYTGRELAGRVLGVVGLGAVGSAVASTCAKLGMRVVGFDPALTAEAAQRVPPGTRVVENLAELLGQAEFVSLHVPLLPSTTHLFDPERLGAMRRGAVLLNFARAAIVDLPAIIAALRDGSLRYYICDFPDAALAGVEHAIVLPHLGASTQEAEENCAVMVVDQVRAFLEDGTIRNAVNFPEVDMQRESQHRMAVAHANVPNMLGQISSAVARAGLNIHNMMNKSRGEVAYTLVDLDSAVADTLVRSVAEIAGVLSVRSLPAA